MENLYVDNWTTSFKTLLEAIECLKEVIDGLDFGHFKMRKFASNHEEVLREIHREDRLEGAAKDIKDDHTIDEMPVLGMLWNKKKDVLQYKVKGDHNLAKVTRREA